MSIKKHDVVYFDMKDYYYIGKKAKFKIKQYMLYI